MKNILNILLAMACSPFFLSAQLQSGFLSDNYAGISSIQLNPAWSATYPLSWDVNIAAVDFFFENNYASLLRTNLRELYKNSAELNILFGPDINTENPVQTGQFIFDFDHNYRKRFVSLQLRIAGPSAMFRLNDRHFFGLISEVRTVMSTQRVPAVFSFYQFRDKPLDIPFEVRKFKTGMMSWTGYGVNYTFKSKHLDGSLAIGATLKYLQGYEAAYFNLNEAFDMTKLSADSIAGNSLDATFGYTYSALENIPQVHPTVNGKGYGIDIGAMYAFHSFTNPDKPYNLKLGFSLLDIGSIRFQNNTQAHAVNTERPANITSRDYTQFMNAEDFNAIIRQFSEDVLSDSTASYRGNSFKMGLPAAMSLQMDYALLENLFLNATLVQGLPGRAITVQRGDYLAVAPRFEHRWFGAGLSAVLYNWQHFRMGATLRLGYLVLGSENLNSFFADENLSGTHFFVALKVNPFDINFGGDYAIKRRRKRGRVKCYTF